MLEWFVSGADYHGVMDVRRGAGRRRRRAGAGDDQGRARRRDDRLRGALAAGRACATRCCEETGVDITEASRDELAELAGEDAEPDDDWAGAGRHPAGQAGRAEADPADLHRRPAARHLAAGQAGRPSTRSCSARPSTGSSPGWRSSAAAPTSTTRSSSARRFVEQRERQESGAEENPHEHDEEFVRALEYGMLTASGCGLGVDRLMMILTGSKTLRDVIIFPSMRERPPRRGAAQLLDLHSRSGSCSTWSVVWWMPNSLSSSPASSSRARWQSASRLDDHVRGERRELRGDLPDVEVVDLDHPRLLAHPPADPVGVDALRRRLEEDPARVAQQADTPSAASGRRPAARRSGRRARTRWRGSGRRRSRCRRRRRGR